MICFIIGIIVFVITFFMILHFEKSFGKALGNAIFCGGFTVILVGMFVWLPVQTICSNPKNIDNPNYQMVTIKENKLIALSEGNGSESNKYVSVSTPSRGSLRYSYIYETDAGYMNNKIISDYVFVKYIKEDETPKVVTWTLHFSNPVKDFLFNVFNTYYTLYIPEGSIILN